MIQKSLLALAALAAAAVLSACAMQARAAPPLVIPLDLNGPRPVVQVSVNGGAPLRAVFDTGTMTTVVNLPFATQLGAANESPLQAPWNQMSPSGEGFQTTIRNLSIGGVVQAPFSAPVLPPLEPNVAMVVSPTQFSGRLVVLDLGASQVRVREKSRASLPPGPGTPYSPAPFSLPAVEVRVGGRSINAHIDSAAPFGLSFPTSYARDLPLATPLAQVGHAQLLGSQTPIYRARINGEVRIGPLILSNPEVTFMDALPMVNVGTDVLRRLTIVIDPEARRSWAMLASSRY
jgi:hypothetical protein